jgi:hypothetical protein
MKAMLAVLVILMFSMASLGAQKGGAGKGGGKCTSDIPVQWELRPTYLDGTPNAIQGDGFAYVNGQSSVQSVVDVCGGTGDVKLVILDPSQRNITVSYSRMLASTSKTPAWALNGETISCMNICFLFNIRNIAYVPNGGNRAEEYAFTTQMQGHSPLNTHNFLLNPDVDAVMPSTLDGANTPYPNSKVQVVHCPAQFTGLSASGLCTSGHPEQWFVWPDATPMASTTQTGLPATQVATLFVDGAANRRYNGGEFSLPFHFVITALQ